MNAFIVALAFSLCMGSPAQVAQGEEPLSKTQIERIKENVRQNLAHRITNIRANTLQLLIDLQRSHPEIDLSFAQLPTMRILKQDKHEGLRILAAVTLFHIGDRRGRFAVQRRAIYDDSPRVAQQCSRLSRYWEIPSVPDNSPPVQKAASLAEKIPVMKVQ